MRARQRLPANAVRAVVEQQSYSGAPEPTRTADTRFRKPLLYPLSYGGISALDYTGLNGLLQTDNEDDRVPRRYNVKIACMSQTIYSLKLTYRMTALCTTTDRTSTISIPFCDQSETLFVLKA